MADQIEWEIDGVIPSQVVAPKSITQLSEWITHFFDRDLTVVPLGGGTKRHIGAPLLKYDCALLTHHLTGLTEYVPEDLTVTVQAGTILNDLQAALSKEHQWLPIDPPHPDRATVGGLLATGFCGPSSCLYGPIRDYVLGITVVQPTGAVTSFGGRVVKNVAGYDVTRLYIGSFGTLGVIAEATFKVLPVPEHRAGVLVSTDSLASLESLLDALVRGPISPAICQVFNRPAAERSPLCTELLDSSGTYAVGLAFDGFEEEVRWSTEQLQKMAKDAGVNYLVFVPTERHQEYRRHIASLHDPARPVVVKIVVPSSEVTLLLDWLTKTIGSDAFIVSSALEGIIRIGLSDDERFLTLLPTIREEAMRRGGFVIAERLPITWKKVFDVWGHSGRAWQLMKELKGALDPKNLFAPGRMGW
ncbi:MAG: FAD-binding oxidoreductase [Armatimonadetes bacterium]|nr:FAD-binding oxidoreductase [Armatimonadota bacterium]MDW8122145.1 FAD-binding oxidoreductase [Armatimonadota bacterium]